MSVVDQVPHGIKRLSEPAAVSAPMGFLRLLHVLESSTVTSYSIPETEL